MKMAFNFLICHYFPDYRISGGMSADHRAGSCSPDSSSEEAEEG
jgi:hypothetical protein